MDMQDFTDGFWLAFRLVFLAGFAGWSITKANDFFKSISGG